MNELEAALESDYQMARIAWNGILYTYYLASRELYVECLPGMEFRTVRKRPQGLPNKGWKSITDASDAAYIVGQAEET